MERKELNYHMARTAYWLRTLRKIRCKDHISEHRPQVVNDCFRCLVKKAVYNQEKRRADGKNADEVKSSSSV